ncbi:YdeI/OmpD-associated family protein [Bacillus cereus]|uniref:YdeI/OmpD-associated family protein n=1 Tax=Bacillus cereus TaxID=1396 RepID=UPI0024BCA681|nr:YdeI/OmpD-associated family protein [Bacillus cereus]WHT87244.1 YdeI/OmpD-associated family protein [Bacillus cereus]
MSIIDKLKLNKYTNMVVINEPSDYEVFTGKETVFSKEHDAIFIFVETLDEMVKQTNFIISNEELLIEKGYIFFAYPKKGNSRYSTFIHRDEMFPALNVGEDGYVGESEIKFARMVSMDDIFTVVGLKREKKKVTKTPAMSQCVADYADRIQDVEALLANHPNELKFYQSLTPGYQKDWTRNLFSVKQEKTREKRLEKMIEVLSQGYKTIELFRKKKK